MHAKVKSEDLKERYLLKDLGVGVKLILILV